MTMRTHGIATRARMASAAWAELSFPVRHCPMHGDPHRSSDYYRNPAPDGLMRAEIVARYVRAIHARAGDRLAIEQAGDRCAELGGSHYEGESIARAELLRPRVELRRLIQCQRCDAPIPAENRTGDMCSACVYDKYL